jgi:zinc transport system permease protein
MGDFWHLGFMQRALIAGSLIAVACSLLGVFLVLRRLSLIGEGLAHFAFGTIGLGLLLNIYPFPLTLVLVVVASWGILYLVDKTNVYADAAIGLVSALGVALGVILASKGRGFNVDLFSYLFGDILAVTPGEAWTAGGLSLAVTATVALFYHELLAVTFDEEFARTQGLSTRRLNQFLVMLTALTIALGIRVVGTLLVSSLVIFPAVTALQLARGFRTVLFAAAGTALLSVVAGILLAYALDLPAGASIVMFNFLLFLGAAAWRLVAKR